MEQSKQRIDLNRDFPVRRSEKEKERFRESVKAHPAYTVAFYPMKGSESNSDYNFLIPKRNGI